MRVQLREAQARAELQSRACHDLRESLLLMKQRDSVLSTQIQELSRSVEANESKYRESEAARVEVEERLKCIHEAETASLVFHKRHLQAQLSAAQNQIAEHVMEKRATEDCYQKSQEEVNKLVQELFEEREVVVIAEKSRKNMELVARDLTKQVDEYQQAVWTSKNALQKSQSHQRDLEKELQNVQRSYLESVKHSREIDRRNKEMLLQVSRCMT